jgi:hypothetical protein
LARKRLQEDRENVNFTSHDIIEHPDLSNPQPVLGLGQSAEPLDPTLAHLGRLVPQMNFQGIPHLGSYVSVKMPEIVLRLRGQDDFVAHSDDTLAHPEKLRNEVGIFLRPLRFPQTSG